MFIFQLKGKNLAVSEPSEATTSQKVTEYVSQKSIPAQQILENVTQTCGTLIAKELRGLMTAAITTDPQKRTEAAKGMYNILTTGAGYAPEKAREIVEFQVGLLNGVKFLLDKNQNAQAAQLAESAKSTEDILSQMSKWGYSDFVTQQQNWLAQYAAMVAMLTQQYAAQEQARQFQMVSTAQQLQALDDFVEKIEKRRREEEAKKESERAASSEERKAKKKAGLKKAESKETEEKEAIPAKLYEEVQQATLLKEGLYRDKGLEIGEVIQDSKFQAIFEDRREEALRGALKDLVPSKLLHQAGEALNFGAGGKRADISKYDSVVQTALVSAYRKSLEQYYEQTPKA